jgi:hypothetical protein
MIGRTVIRCLRISFWTSLLFLISLATLLFVFHRSHYRVRALLVEYRDTLTSRFESDSGVFVLKPDALIQRGFHTDSEALVDAWRPRLAKLAPLPKDLSKLDEIDQIKAIVLSFSRPGSGHPIYFMPLAEKTVEAQRGNGFCSDHVEIFLSLARIHGLFARELQNDVHDIAEAFSPSRKKWIWVDPLYAVLATDEQGTYLSYLEMRNRRLTGLPVRFLFFGVANRQPQSEADPRFQQLYGDPSQFKRYVLTYGNNVLTEASRSESLAFLPWEARQLALYISGTKPGLLQLIDPFVDRRAIESVRRRALVFWLISAYFALSLASYPLGLFTGRFALRAASRRLQVPIHQDPLELNRSSDTSRVQ